MRTPKISTETMSPMEGLSDLWRSMVRRKQVALSAHRILFAIRRIESRNDLLETVVSSL